MAVSLTACGDETPTTKATRPAYAERLHGSVQATIDELKVPSAVVLVRSESQGDWTATFGTRTIGGNGRVTVDDHYRIGSNTKTMTAAVILQLVQEGKLRLDDPVAMYRPDVPNGQNITIAQMLEMRSGLFSYTFDEALRRGSTPTPSTCGLRASSWASPCPSAVVQSGHQLRVLEYQHGAARPDRRTADRQVGGRPVPPQDLRTARTEADDDARGQGQQHSHASSARLHVRHQPQHADGAGSARIPTGSGRNGTLRPGDFTDSSPSWAWAAGSAISTADDLGRYVEGLVDGELLNAAQQRALLASFRPVGPDPTGPQYGYHLAKLGPMIGHTGQIPGYSSFMGRDPQQRNTVIVLTSLVNAPNGASPAAELTQKIIAALYQ